MTIFRKYSVSLHHNPKIRMTTPPQSDIARQRLFQSSGIGIFRSLNDISFISFPYRLDVMLLCVCISGEISAIIDLTPRHMRSSSIMVLRPGHNLSECKESQDFDGFFIVVHEDRLNELLPSLQYLIPNAIHFKDNPIIEITREELQNQVLIHALFRRKLKEAHKEYNSQTIKSLCEVLFYDTLGIYTSRAARHTRRLSRREDLLARFISLVDTHYRSQRSVMFYARELCVTPKHLSAVLKDVSGKTAGEWIDYRVILEAKIMLRKSGLTIQEISLELNFSNQSFFGKYFKHFTGMSPREYRMRDME